MNAWSRSLIGALLLAVGCSDPPAGAPDLAVDEADLAAPADLSPAPDLVTGPVTKVTGFDVPESAHFHEGTAAYYVSNLSLTDLTKLNVKDNKGWISKLDRDFKVVEARWFETGLSSPAGIRVLGNTLVVANIDELVLINVTTKAVMSRVAVPGAGLLNDVDIAADGTIYATDTFTNTIWSYQMGGTPQKLLTDAALSGPNGILVLPNRLLVASTGPFDQPQELADLWNIPLDTKAPGKTGFRGKLDGLELDGTSILVSDNPTARVYRISQGQLPQLVRDFTQDGLKTAADIGFDAGRRVLAVPDLQTGTVTFVRIP